MSEKAPTCPKCGSRNYGPGPNFDNFRWIGCYDCGYGFGGERSEKAPNAFAENQQLVAKIADEITTLRAENAELKKQLESKTTILNYANKDWADDDTRVKALAAPFIGDMEKGDGHGEFVCVVGVTERLVARIATMAALLDKVEHIYPDLQCSLNNRADRCPACQWQALKLKQ